MALVPFRVAGAAASQQLGEQLLQVGPDSLLLHQRPKESGNTAHLQRAATRQQDQPSAGLSGDAKPAEAAEAAAGDQQQQKQQQPDLSRVGLVLWQSGYVLSDFLLLRLPQLQAGRHGCSSSWAGARVLELGCGAGTVGMFLALAGAQVVLTDLLHILPLTQENLELNFPLTSTAAASTGNSARTSSGRTGTFGRRTQQAVQQQNQAKDISVSAAQLDGASGLRTVSHETQDHQQQQSAAALSAAAAFAAAFCDPAAVAWPAEQQQQPAVDCDWQVFAAGPLIVEYSWGEPAEHLQQRVAAAAAARLHATASHAAVQQEQEGVQQQQQQQQQQEHAQEQSSLSVACQSRAYDFVVGADLLYDPTYHQALLTSLQQLCAPHTQVFLCYRCRGLGEKAFQAAAAAAGNGSGWAVEAVPFQLLHPEYQAGDYRVLRMMKTG